MHRKAELPPAVEEVRPLLHRAEQGDREALALLRAWLDANPAVWQQIADLGVRAVDAQIATLVGDDLLVREAINRQLQELERKFAGTDPSPLQHLISQRISLSWLQSYHADLLLAQAQEASRGHVRFLEQRAHRAQRRLLAAIREWRLLREFLSET